MKIERFNTLVKTSSICELIFATSRKKFIGSEVIEETAINYTKVLFYETVKSFCFILILKK